MELRAEFQIPTLIKALTEVVLPAVDPANKLAIEQGQLIVGMLHLIAQRLPLQARYDRHELQDFLSFAERLTGQAASLPEAREALAGLAPSVEQGRATLAIAGADPADVRAAILALRTATGAVVSATAVATDRAAVQAISATVMQHAEGLLRRERAYIAMQGWEGPNAGLPALETLIG